MQTAQTDAKEYSYFADNQWRKAADNRIFEVYEPYSGKLFARVASASRADARAAVDAAAKAFTAWADSTPAERARLFLKASEIVRRRRTEIAEIPLAKPGPLSRSPRSRWTWSRRPCSRLPAGSIYPKARFWRQINPALIRLACGAHWVFARALPHGTVPTFYLGAQSYRRSQRETRS